VDNVLAEMKQVHELYPTASFFIGDDSFLMTPTEWLEEFRHRYPKEIGVPFGCNIRANQASEHRIRLLAEAGCNHCWFGLECGDEEFSNRVLKRNLKNSQILEAAKLLRKYNIPFLTQNITALPTDAPLATDMKTINLNIKCKPDYAMAHLFFPFPGTELGQYTIKKGLFKDDSILTSRICHTSPLEFPTGLKNQLERQRALLALAVAYPALKYFLPILRKLPLTQLYLKMHLHYAAYCMEIIMRPNNKGVRHNPYAYIPILLKACIRFILRRGFFRDIFNRLSKAARSEY